MREIIFRGKRIPDGVWVEGDLLHNGDSILICNYDDELKSYHVDPETVGQYSGHKDKTGKRIFEGDILKLPDSPHFQFRIGWSSSGFAAVKYYQGYLITWMPIADLPTDCMIVSNIHDN